MIFEILFKANVKRRFLGPVVLLLGLLVLAGCTSGSSGSEYVNPGRPETYDPQETSYEKPWPFGDLGNGH
jgi:hypothetical protein